MAQQTFQSNLAAKFGPRITQANAASKDAPPDVGVMRLPPGIQSGIAKVQTITKGVYKNGALKGEEFCRFAAVVLTPQTHAGVRCAGMQTSIIVPLCDEEAKGNRPARSLDQNWFDYQNMFKILSDGKIVCHETDPTRIVAFFEQMAVILTDPARAPTYVTFSTRGWTPPKTMEKPNPEEMVFETWHGTADPAQLNGLAAHNPAGGVTERLPAAAQPRPSDAPPTMGPDGLPILTNQRIHEPPADFAEPSDAEALVAELVEVANNDPEGATEEGADAAKRLEEMAWAMGWTREDTEGVDGWHLVGEMALTAPEPAAEVVPVVGGSYKFCKRDKTTGAKLVNGQGQPFPAVDVHVVTVDTANKTCTLKQAKDGKEVVDIRSKKPIQVKWEWLEKRDHGCEYGDGMRAPESSSQPADPFGRGTIRAPQERVTGSEASGYTFRETLMTCYATYPGCK